MLATSMLNIEAHSLRVRSRESKTIEFKSQINKRLLRKCVKTVAGFANTSGGSIVFGVSDSPRRLIGIDENSVPDQAEFDDVLEKYLSPIPEVVITTETVFGQTLLIIKVLKYSMPPIFTIADLMIENDRLLQKGCVYTRRSGKTCPAGIEEITRVLNYRDDQLRSGFWGILNRVQKLGTENIAVADFSNSKSIGSNVELYVPVEAAAKLNVVKKGKMINEFGIPAYSLNGEMRFTSYSDKDPRKPLLAKQAVWVLRSGIENIFWKDIPWSIYHLSKVARHLGFWNSESGDNVNTAREELSNRPKYLEKGRLRILDFAKNSSDEFIEVTGSMSTKQKWKELSEQRKTGREQFLEGRIS